ncbi:hypothetical protein NW762_014081 [Fusarium torreyae]|uniref:Uncharacterized protein n=1 Tax=Fusarium torreyae TaxID=1237075 RepID=A0A9W8RJA9_9HYPO|nr:hypothetical protein NW762_014081 [Fusarium torreyae]
MFDNSSNTTKPSETCEERVPNNEVHVLETPNNPSVSISREHAKYMMERHGILDLNPMPGPDKTDPYNWPNWKVSFFASNMLLLSY